MLTPLPTRQSFLVVLIGQIATSSGLMSTNNKTTTTNQPYALCHRESGQPYKKTKGHRASCSNGGPFGVRMDDAWCMSFMIVACAAGTTSRAGGVFLRAYQGAKNALQQTINGAHCFAASASTLRCSSDNALGELFFLVAPMGRGFLMSLLRILRDYPVVACLIKNTRSITETIAP